MLGLTVTSKSDGAPSALVRDPLYQAWQISTAIIRIDMNMGFRFDIKTSCKVAFTSNQERCHAKDSSTRKEAAQGVQLEVVGNTTNFSWWTGVWTFQVRKSFILLTDVPVLWYPLD